MKSSSIRSFLQNPAPIAPSTDLTDQKLWLRGLEIAMERAPYPFLPALTRSFGRILLPLDSLSCWVLQEQGKLLFYLG